DELFDRTAGGRVLRRLDERGRADARAGVAVRRRLIMRIFAVLLLVWVAGCGGGPDVERLRDDVEARLSGALPANTVSLASLDRRGSQSDTKAPAGETRRVVYFDATLKLGRDFDFGAWDSPGVA